jgi:hypothetical protein
MQVYIVSLADGQRRFIATDNWFAAVAIAQEKFDAFVGLTVLGPLDAIVHSEDDDDRPPSIQ